MNHVWRAVVVLGVIGLATGARAQSSNDYFSTMKQPLSEAATRGQGLFLQRCSICHLPQLPGWGLPSGPVLSGRLLRLANPQAEERFREKVLEGSSRMPAFRYGLQPQQLDDLVAYFKAAS